MEKAIAENDVVVVGMAMNPNPKKARSLLSKRGIPFAYLEYGSYLGTWRRRNALKMWTGWPTFPMVFVKGTLVGGASDLEKLAESGELDRMLDASRAVGVCQALTSESGNQARDFAAKVAAENTLAQATAEAEGILTQAREEVTRMQSRAAASLQNQIALREQQALDRIAQSEAAAAKQVRDTAVDVALSATRSLLREQVGSGKSQDLVEQAIERLAIVFVQLDPDGARAWLDGDPLGRFLDRQRDFPVACRIDRARCPAERGLGRADDQDGMSIGIVAERGGFGTRIHRVHFRDQTNRAGGF